MIKTLAKDLTEKYGQGFQKRKLYHFVDFYVKFCNIFVVKCNEFERDTIVNAVSSQSSAGDLFHLLVPKSSIRLSWTHYGIIYKSQMLMLVLGMKMKQPTKEELRREIEQQKEFYRLKCESGINC